MIMNLDAYHLNTGILSFYIPADNANDAMLGNLMAAYKTFATDGRLAEALQAAGSKMAVSYTHLDVYKRQEIRNDY